MERNLQYESRSYRDGRVVSKNQNKMASKIIIIHVDSFCILLFPKLFRHNVCMPMHKYIWKICNGLFFKNGEHHFTPACHLCSEAQWLLFCLQQFADWGVAMVSVQDLIYNVQANTIGYFRLLQDFIELKRRFVLLQMLRHWKNSEMKDISIPLNSQMKALIQQFTDHVCVAILIGTLCSYIMYKFYMYQWCLCLYG